MGYGYGTRSPYEVQRHNGGRYTFDTIKARYEAVKPLRGQRKELNIRPLGERRRDWEQVFMVNENEYYISYDAYSSRDNQAHNRAITWFKRDDFEIITIHTPRAIWNKPDEQHLRPYVLSSPSVFYFYDCNLPKGLFMENYKSCKYVGVMQDDVPHQFFTAEKGDITFQRKVSDKYWKPVVIHREFKHSLDRSKTKVLRESVKPFLEYFNVVAPLIEKGQYFYGNALEDFGASVFNKVGDDIPDNWFKIAERYKYRNHWYKSDIKEIVIKDIYRVAKPLNKEPVPLGTPVRDRYRNWV